jgi:hypothetical protein
MDRRKFLLHSMAAGAASSLRASSVVDPPVLNDRDYWIQILKKISTPVLRALSERKLKATMPVEAPHGNVEERRRFTHLEAMGRLLMGISPWLESGPNLGQEGALRAQYAEWSRAAIQSATDPGSPDFMNFNQGNQPLVDTAFLALAILRAPTELWHKLNAKAKENVIAALQSSRIIRPGYNNWLLFSAMVETCLLFIGADWDRIRVDYAIQSVETWYKGDGVYGDGPSFHWDYYNSFVIQPLLLNILDSLSRSSDRWKAYKETIRDRARRYAAIQERLIGPDGCFPPVGRSLPYRFGAFHLLAEIALRRELPKPVSPEQVRSALTAVMRRMVEAPGTLDRNGWLTVGFFGHQPEIAEPYVSTGSCYLCSAMWLPLGLPSTDRFWSAPETPWTSKRAWGGEQVEADHALVENPHPGNDESL